MFVSVKGWSLLWAEKIPSEYWNNKILLMSVKTRFCSWLFQVTKSSLTNFYCFNIHAFISLRKRGIPRQLTINRKSWSSYGLCARFKVTIFLWTEKIPSEYWNNRILLMSFKTQFFSRFFQVTKRLINQFLLFKYSCVYILVKKWNSEKSFNFIEGAWLAVACV